MAERNNNLFILDNTKNIKGILSNRMPFSLSYFDDLKTRDINEGTDVLELKVPASHEESYLIETGNYILYPDKRDGLKPYLIQEVTEVSDSGEYYKEVYAELSAQADLIKDVVRPVTFESADIQEVIKHILSDTDWTVGVIAGDFGIKKVTIEGYPTKLQALYDVFNQFGAEINFEYETDKTKVTKQSVSAYEELGYRTGKGFKYGKDLKGVERHEDRTKLVTALIGVGKNMEDSDSPLTFSRETEELLGSQLGGFPEDYEKPEGVDYVGSLKALERYGVDGKHIMGVYEDDDAESSYKLFTNTLEKLKKYEKPLMTYETKVITLSKLTGYAHEFVGIGDRVSVHDETFNPQILVEARIRKIKESLTNPDSDEVELGDYIPINPPVSTQIQKVQDKIREKEKVWDKAQQVDNIQKELSNMPTMKDLHSIQSERIKVRYIRDYLEGNDVDNNNRWVELQVFHKGSNIASGLTPTANGSINNPSYLTDDVVDSEQYAYLSNADDSLEYMEIDLGRVYEDVEYLHLWHYYSDGRSYKNFVDVSEDGQVWIRVYNSERNGKHTESSDGFVVPVNSSAITKQQEKEQATIVEDVDNVKDVQQSQEATLKGKVDLTAYNNKVDAIESDIANKADFEYVNGELVTKANDSDVYKKEEVDNALSGKVSTTVYNNDKSEDDDRFTALETDVSQNKKDIELKASSSKVDKVENRVTSAESSIKVNAENITQKVDESTYTTDKNNMISSIESNSSSISQNKSDIELKASNTKVNKIEDRVSSNESTLSVHSDEISSKVTAQEVKEIASDENSISFRYVRYIAKGNSENDDSRLNEIKVLRDGDNLATGASITSSDSGATGLSKVIDNSLSNSSYAEFGSSEWVQIDLGSVEDNIDSVDVWHHIPSSVSIEYFYNLQISDDGVNWISLFDTDRNSSYVEDNSGFTILVNQQKAVKSHASDIRQTAEAIKSKAEASDVNSLGQRLSTAEEEITDDSIVNTVMSSQEITQLEDSKANKSDISNMATTGDVDDALSSVKANYVQQTDFEQSNEEFNFKLSNSGGVNLLKNSVGFAGTDLWTVSGTVKTIQSGELETNGAGSGFKLMEGTISQEVSVNGGDYTLSMYVKKGTSGSGYLKVHYDNDKTETVDFTSNTSYNYEEVVQTINVKGNSITVELYGDASSDIVFTSIMLNKGNLKRQWTHSDDEIYNYNVKINERGVQVLSSEFDGYTSITPREFAGYYKGEKVFTLNKGTTEMNRAKMDREITMDPIKIIPLKTGGYSGWAFVKSTQ